MRRLLAIVLLLCLLACAGCTATSGDWFAPFQGGFSAELDGTLGGVAFAAQMVADAPDANGARAVTLTFYAPEGLKGATLTRGKEGRVTFARAGLELQDPPVAAIGALFELFPTGGEVQSVRVTENGNTRVTGEGFALEFRADGTPAAIETPAARATVVSWRAQ
ncbi:MAG: hypothetical protein IJA78_04610 [Clostridia bacterium]|nr:hypothetical protein [Clostridia bacterium]